MPDPVVASQGLVFLLGELGILRGGDRLLAAADRPVAAAHHRQLWAVTEYGQGISLGQISSEADGRKRAAMKEFDHLFAYISGCLECRPNKISASK